MEGYTQNEYHLILEDENDDEEELENKKSKIKYSPILQEEEIIED
jgi:hypothetical protein